MSHPQYRFGFNGLAGELSFPSLDEVLIHLKNHLGNFILDPAVTAAYLNRLAADPGIAGHAQGLAALRHLARTFHMLRPLDAAALQLLQTVDPRPEWAQHAALVRHYPPDASLESRLEKLRDAGRPETSARLLLDLLAKKPGMLWHADQLLSIQDAQVDPDLAWLETVQFPPACEGLWRCRLATFHARGGRHEEALRQWEATPEDWRTTHARMLLAESCVALGDVQEGIAKHEAALARDPLLFPLRHRLESLRHPLVINHDLVKSRRTAIHLYSWNKADLLRETLQSLADSDIGEATVQVLLNGCTDDSRAVVQAMHAERFGDKLECIELPVNVGAPAARNWLVAHPSTARADYTAFLDDDVILPRDWFSTLLTRMEQHPQAGVAGCKILFPGTPPRLQYLHRNFSLVRDDIFRLSLDSPNDRRDLHLYDYTRKTDSVMGCCHVFRREALQACPTFDLRYSPSQMDDIAHDFDLRLKGFETLYCGEAAVVHKQETGRNFLSSNDISKLGNVLGNDVKFYHRFYERREQLKALRNPSDFLFPG